MGEMVWQPNTADILIGQQAYVEYLGGVCLLQRPDSEFARGLIGPMTYMAGGNEQVVAHAENVMYRGLKGVLYSANPEGRSLTAAEHNYDRVLPNIMTIIDATKTERASQLNEMNPAFCTLPPNPLANPKVYNFICHGRRGKLHTLNLISPYLAAPQLDEVLAGRQLGGAHRMPQGEQENN